MLLLVAAVVAALPACSERSGPPLPSPPQVVDLEMQEYRFALAPPTEAGRVVLRVRNGGKLDHDLVLTELPEDLPPILEQLRGSTRRNATNLASLRPRKPGSRTAFAVDLAPGRYALICFLRDPDGQQHATKGMAVEFRVGKT